MTFFLSLCIESLLNCYSVRPTGSDLFFKPNWSFREHLHRALPTDMIFYLLRSIRSEHFICDYSQATESIPDTLEIIIKWLQVGVTVFNRQTPKIKFQFISRDLVPSARATCMIVSTVNIFDRKRSVNIDSQGFHNHPILI